MSIIASLRGSQTVLRADTDVNASARPGQLQSASVWVGLVLDAHIRHVTNGRKSMDDVLRLEYQRWSGARGYTAADFNRTVSDAAGVDVGGLLHRLIATTEEIDYTEMLDWFGLQFAAGDDWAEIWILEVRPDATEVQKQHLAALLAHSNN